MKKYFTTAIILFLLFILWFAPIDLNREKEISDSIGSEIIIYVLENMWLKITISIFFIFALVGLYSKENN